ncbi:MAG TPA: hypothetical protein VID95_09515 [Candidatus Limnocylindrales bacterium]|jgi:hypothetical protein
MADLLRVGLRTATIVTIGATGWLVSVLVTIVPARDPRSEPLWIAIAACAAAVSLAALLATMRREHLGRGLAAALALLSAAVAVVGVLDIDSQAELPDGGHGEGYLLALGLILAVQGLLGLAWLGAVSLGRR